MLSAEFPWEYERMEFYLYGNEAYYAGLSPSGKFPVSCASVAQLVPRGDQFCLAPQYNQIYRAPARWPMPNYKNPEPVFKSGERPVNMVAKGDKLGIMVNLLGYFAKTS